MRGITIAGQIITIQKKIMACPGIFPNLPKNFRQFPSNSNMLTKPITGKKVEVKRNPKAPQIILSPESIPVLIGNIKLPAPKSIENIARDVAIIVLLEMAFTFYP